MVLTRSQKTKEESKLNPSIVEQEKEEEVELKEYTQPVRKKSKLNPNIAEDEKEEEEKEEQEPKEYIIQPVRKKATFEKEEWVNSLSNGKSVIVNVTTFYRGGSFLIRLTDAEKASILTATSIDFEDYDFEFQETYDGTDR